MLQHYSQSGLKPSCEIYVTMMFWIYMLMSVQHLLSVEGFLGRLDLGLVMDTSAAMNSDKLNLAKKFTERFLQHYSISQGTTRVSLADLHEKTRLIISYQKHVNREHFLESLKDVSCCSKESVSPKSVRKAIRLLANGGDNRKSKTFFIVGEKSFKMIQNEIEKKTRRRKHEIIIIIVGKTVGKEITESCLSLSVGCYILPSSDAIERVKEDIGVPSANYTSCSGSGKVFDECERHCDCINGELRNCYRIRKEFTQMTKRERQRYINTYFKLTTEQPFKNQYENFVYLHFKYFCYGIHRRDLFCPWHRFYILQMENLLRQIDCRVTLPYWDWSFVAKDPWNRTHIWRKTDDGLGGNGVKKHGFCVQTGVFRQWKWYTPFFNDALDIVASTYDLFDNMKEDEIVPDLSDCLRRYFYGTLPDELFLRRSLKIPADNFEDFDINLRINYHDRIHNAIGGTMCTHFAATAPEFFLHHSFLDKIWFMWQQKSTAHRNAHFTDVNMKLIGFTHNAKDLIDSHNLPGNIKVTYSKFPERRMEKRDKINDAEYLDDNNKPPNSVYHGILETASKRVFPSCDRSRRERLRAEELSDLFSSDEFNST